MCAMRRAAARAASLRGSSITMRSFGKSHEVSKRRNGASVVLPEPGGATSTARRALKSADES